MRRWLKPTHAQHFANKQPIFQQDVESKYQPVPFKGWDAISPLSAMEPDYGVILDNCVPRPGWVEARGGYNAWCQGLSEPVESLLVYRPDNGNEAMFAASGAFIWDVTSVGVPSIVQSGLSSARWQYINFTPTVSNTHMILVNGVDNGLIYDGTTWSSFSPVGFSSTSAATITAFKRRIWMTEVNSSDVWYMGTDAIAGTASRLQLGSFLTKGSNIISIGHWTIDGGNGPDDYIVFISNKGQAVLYKGTDPDNPNAWFLVGVFDLPSPIGRRCFTKMGADTLYISLEGLLPLSKALPFDPAGARSVSLTNRIQNAMSEAARTYRDNFGWETKLFPLQNLLVMNVPTLENSSQMQFVMNTLTGAWCRFTGWNANTFEIYNESLYFGDNDGNVNLAYAGGMDLVSPMLLDMKCAYNYYDDPGRIKIAQMVKAYIKSSGNIVPSIGIDVDFGESELIATISSITQLGSLWDSALWDVGTWSVSSVTINNWYTVVAIGTALALRIKVNLAVDDSSDTLSSSVFDTGVFDEMVFDGNGATQRSGQLVPLLQFNQFQVVLEHGAAVG